MTCLEWLPGSTLFKKMAGQLRFAELNLKEPKCFWSNVSWKDETKVEMLSNMFGEKETTYQRRQINCQARWWRGDNVGLFFSHGIWPAYN